LNKKKARILCEAGTYIRKLYYDIGEVLGPGATMIELRRSRVDQFHEKDGLVTLHELANAFAIWEEKKDDTKLMQMIKPVEFALSELKSVVIRDSAVDAMCHGAQLAIPGVLQISSHLKAGDIVGIYTQKGEAVALAESTSHKKNNYGPQYISKKMANKTNYSEGLKHPTFIFKEVLAKSLVIFIGIGIVAGFAFGVYLIDFKTTTQLVFVEGSSISIVTEKFNFKQDELIQIKIINSGTNALTFSDSSYGLKITGLSGILMYSPISAQVISILDPEDEIIFSWDQIKNDGNIALDGVYKISVKGIDGDGNNIEKSTTVTIWK